MDPNSIAAMLMALFQQQGPGRQQPGGVPDSGNRGVADLVSDPQASQQAREAAAHRTSQGVLGRGFSSADEEEMRRHNGMLSASQTQYANDRPIQVFRPGIQNPIWGWGRQ